ncbi:MULTISPECIES: helix-turn-helix domain-containing protein [Enterococcus]|uniref:Helix-turn-helix transcriptional regulator n=1 Tax=Enterococcus xiangfangensis TaxID=1296537 RepID=A0ABU3FCV3_9ENTE|nr:MULTISPECIES: helix-turn-helix transcriptional regulator [Enterococcus]MDT2759847.1 helix-turn-helix transcriptional regulator [Enterococcus xiangfangensis]
MDINKEEVGQRISIIRKKLGLTMDEFGRKINGASKSNVSKWESGSSLPNNERLKKIAEEGEVSVAYLLAGEKQEISYSKLAFDNSYSNAEEIFNQLSGARKSDYAFAFDAFSSLFLRSIEHNNLERFDDLVYVITRLNDFDKTLEEWTAFDGSVSLSVLGFNDYVQVQEKLNSILNETYDNLRKVNDQFYNAD